MIEFRFFFIIEICYSKMALIEVDSIRKLRHPNIVSYRGAWLEGKRSFILMEFARHGTLKDLLEKRQMPLKEEVIVQIK